MIILLFFLCNTFGFIFDIGPSAEETFMESYKSGESIKGSYFVKGRRHTVNFYVLSPNGTKIDMFSMKEKGTNNTLKVFIKDRMFDVKATETGEYKFVFKTGGVHNTKTVNFYLEKNMLPEKNDPKVVSFIPLEERYSTAEEGMKKIYLSQQNIRVAELQRRQSFDKFSF
jgi:hypothetical protein